MQNIIATYSAADEKQRNVMETQFKDIELKRIKDWISLKNRNRIAQEEINEKDK